MRFTLSWLQDYLDTTATLAEISQRLTALGLEVEKIVDKAAELSPFTIAEIIEAEKHPKADKLRVCKVNTGSAILQIVCGAPNARAGIKVVLAPVGSVIPTNGLKIKASSIRDVESNGMLCSARELGIGDDHNGIIELSADAPLGSSFAAWEGLDDPVIEIAITPNRGDCLGVYGIARDLAASGLGTLKPLDIAAIAGNSPCPVTVAFQDVDPAVFFTARYFKNVKNTEGPAWLRQRLEAIGIKPISALVDITNYISFSFGRPLHVYDADNVKGNILLRPAKEGESFTALDNKTYLLQAGMPVIADEEGVISLPGIIGGVRTGCSSTTTNVLLESAYFPASVVSSTGRTLMIDSDARYRFEREVDKGFVVPGAELASNMIVSLCGGEASFYSVTGDNTFVARVTPFNESKVETLGGIHLENNIIHSILTKLGFHIEAGNVTVPSWRHDVQGEADLVEEVLRVHGYDALPATPLPPANNFTPAVPKEQQRATTTRTLLASRGFTEAVTWSFIPHSVATLFGGGQSELRLQNPISTELETMRPSLLPNLLEAVKRNSTRGYSDLRLFEVGPVFHGVNPDEQPVVAASLRSGQAAPKTPYGNARSVDVFDSKADILALIAEYGLATDKLTVTRDAPAWYHPGRSGALRLGNKTIGVFGELHPAILNQLDINVPVVAFELFMSYVPFPKPKYGRKPAADYSDYQAVERDFAFIVANDIPADQVLKAVKSAEKELVRDVALFDVYSGKGVEDGYKSLALSVTLQAKNCTLREEEIATVSRNVIDSVKKQTQGKLRG